MAGPRTRQKLQPRSMDVLENLSDRYYRAGNTEGMEGINQELQNRIQNHPVLQPGSGFISPGRPEEGAGGVGQGSFWNVKADQDWNNSGVMLASSGKNWMADNPWFLNLMADRHGDSQTLEYLEDAIGGGGLPLWGGNLKPTWGNDGYGLSWKIGLGG